MNSIAFRTVFLVMDFMNVWTYVPRARLPKYIDICNESCRPTRTLCNTIESLFKSFCVARETNTGDWSCACIDNNVNHKNKTELMEKRPLFYFCTTEYLRYIWRRNSWHLFSGRTGGRRLRIRKPSINKSLRTDITVVWLVFSVSAGQYPHHSALLPRYHDYELATPPNNFGSRSWNGGSFDEAQPTNQRTIATYVYLSSCQECNHSNRGMFQCNQ